nr:MAG TPA: hypothetical protein [Caudoviricetes sp.]
MYYICGLIVRGVGLFIVGLAPFILTPTCSHY